MDFTKISKTKRFAAFMILLCAEMMAFNLEFYAQEIEAKIKILPSSRVHIEGRIFDKYLISRDLYFLQNYADVNNLGARIENLKLFDEKGAAVEFKKTGTAKFEANQIFSSWEYDVNIKVSENLTDAAHVSWLSENQGLLMPGDLLPQVDSNNKQISAKITLEIPSDWKISTSETATGDNVFNVKNFEKAVFLIGNNRREKTIQVNKTNLNFAVSGAWSFSDEEANQMANAILREHEKTFGDIPSSKVQIILLPFPQNNAASDRWRAETRGSTVTIISGQIPQKSIALQRLHEQFRHEIFHCWLPNAVNLSGNYDWFYEGFTIYQALRTGVELGQIRFEDYLNTLSRADDISRNTAKSQNLSLLEASQNRWTGANNFIYAKGLIVAFLCDVALLNESQGKRSLKDIFRQTYEKHRFPNESQDGRTAILRILKSYPELVPVVQNYVEGKEPINWDGYLKAAGIEVENSRLKVKEKPDRRQKDLLDKLGYNQWLKVSQKMK